MAAVQRFAAATSDEAALMDAGLETARKALRHRDKQAGDGACLRLREGIPVAA
jgi:hypothetical protein